MKLSFIITAFNRPHALRTCLSCLVQQTFEAWEAIVVDNSDSLANAYTHYELTKMDKRFRYMNTEVATEVKGAMHTRCLYTATEIGVNKTAGEWLCFPNDDSYYCPWFAERMLGEAERQDWELVYCDLIAGGAGGHWLLQAQPKLCCIDKTNFMVKRRWFDGFRHKTGESYPQADGELIEELVRRGIRHGRLSQVLVVHN